jgi:hypothetical protein
VRRYLDLDRELNNLDPEGVRDLSLANAERATERNVRDIEHHAMRQIQSLVEESDRLRRSSFELSPNYSTSVAEARAKLESLKDRASSMVANVARLEREIDKRVPEIEFRRLRRNGMQPMVNHLNARKKPLVELLRGTSLAVDQINQMIAAEQSLPDALFNELERACGRIMAGRVRRSLENSLDAPRIMSALIECIRTGNKNGEGPQYAYAFALLGRHLAKAAPMPRHELVGVTIGTVMLAALLCRNIESSALARSDLAIRTSAALMFCLLVAIGYTRVVRRLNADTAHAQSDQILQDLLKRRLVRGCFSKAQQAQESLNAVVERIKAMPNVDAQQIEHWRSVILGAGLLDGKRLMQHMRAIETWGEEKMLQALSPWLRAHAWLNDRELPAIHEENLRDLETLSNQQRNDEKALEEESAALVAIQERIDSQTFVCEEIQRRRQVVWETLENQNRAHREIDQETHDAVANLRQQYRQDVQNILAHYHETAAHRAACRAELEGLFSEQQVLEWVRHLMTPFAFEMVQQRHLAVEVPELRRRTQEEGRFINGSGLAVRSPAGRASSWPTTVHLLQALLDAHKAVADLNVDPLSTPSDLLVEHQRPLGVVVDWSREPGEREIESRASRVSFVGVSDGGVRVSHIYPV